jgi:hypothetical protein
MWLGLIGIENTFQRKFKINTKLFQTVYQN